MESASGRIVIILGMLSFLNAFSNQNFRKVYVNSITKKCKIAMKKESLNDIRLDISKLSESEKERITNIQRATADADNLMRSQGFPVDVESSGEDVYKSVGDTNWSGQSESEALISSENNWKDLLTRWPLALGDISSLTLFASIGRMNHGEGLDPLSVMITAGPFLFSWLLVSPLLGAYSLQSTSTKVAAPLRILPAWAVSIPLAIAFRGLLKGEVPPTPFVVVTLVATFTLLTLWRVSYIALFGETTDSEYRKAGILEVFKMVSTLLRRW